MNHILKKIGIAGGGKSKKAKPPIYKPPVMGELQYGASHSYAETLDLVSDGPIGGIVNSHGQLVDGLNILQGIYLDDTAVAVTNSANIRQITISEFQRETIESLNLQLADGSVSSCKKFFSALDGVLNKSGGGKITALPSSTAGDTDVSEAASWPDVGMMFVRDKTSDIIIKNTERQSGLKIEPPLLPTQQSNVGLYIRAYIALGSDVFPWHLNKELKTGFSTSNAAYRDNDQPKGTVEDSSLIWSESTSLQQSKFLFAFNPTIPRTSFRDGSRMEKNTFFQAAVDQNKTTTYPLFGEAPFFHDNQKVVSELVFSELNSIRSLVRNNLGADANKTQGVLATRCLERLGINVSNGIPDTDKLLNEYLRGGERGAFIVCKIESQNNNLVGAVVKEGDSIINLNTLPYGSTHGFDLIALLQSVGVRYTDLTCPIVSQDGVLTGEMKGFILIELPPTERETTDLFSHVGQRKAKYGNGYTYKIDSYVISYLKDLESFRFSKVIGDATLSNTSSFSNDIVANGLKFNYSNVLAEIRKGEEKQDLFSNFKNINIDHFYNRELFGPFSTREAAGNPNAKETQVNAPQRISPDRNMLLKENVLGSISNNYNTKLQNGLPISEGSDDVRKDAEGTQRNYSSWGQNSFANFDEKPVPVVHTVYNPNVSHVFITLDVSSLSDTLIKEVEKARVGKGLKDENLSIGTKFPSVLNIEVETGTVGDKNNNSDGQIPFKKYNFRLVAQIESNTLIDIGNPESLSDNSFLVDPSNTDSPVNRRPFLLPNAVSTNREALTADGERGVEAATLSEDATSQRYVKITKLSFESNSALLSKIVSVNKVTEIINSNLTYPFSAIIATKLDSRSFSSIPSRSFDCKLKKVKIPSNYFPTNNGIDNRYYDNQKQFDNANPKNKLIYKGDWDGTFHDELQWTDNPAWILYDLLTNVRYGMGSHIDLQSINKWQLYKIGRFCDAVDNEGNFVGVTDGRGGKEPRFSCNVVFDQGQQVFDAINTIASLFRGRTFFTNSEINFVDDRPREPVNLFTNESVKDGLFFYSNNSRDQQANTIEISYKDRFDNFSPKLEVVEDEEDIKERGILKKRIEGIGITSRAMARRAAQHNIFSKIKEDQTVAFTAGLETLLCKPGDLVIIQDELKTNKSNFGKVLDVSIENETIRLSNTFAPTTMDSILTVYNPTGAEDISDLNLAANQNRQRYDGFTITGLATDSWKRFTGEYSFSGYTEGYDQATGFVLGETRYSEYASYTGVSGTNLYFETGVTGWVFGSGNARSLYSGDLISELTGTQTLTEFNTGKISVLNMNAADKRGSSTIFSGFDPSTFRNYTRGATNSEVSNISPEQITTLLLTGGSQAVTNKEYGTLLSGFDRPEVLPFIKLGSAAQFQIKEASPFIYKVISMKEENPNEYLVSATKYDTGKFNLIDNNVSIEYKANTFSYQVAQTINGITYKTLDAPEFVGQVVTGIPNATDQTFNITGNWTDVSNATGYGVRLTLPNGQVIQQGTAKDVTNISLSGLDQVGVFNLSVNALGNMGRDGETNAYYDSAYIDTGIFVLYEETLTYSKSFLNKITIL